MKNKNTIWSYLVVVFVLSYLWQLTIYLTGGIDSNLFPVLMLFPGIVAIAFFIINKESIRVVSWGLGSWWYILPALILPILFILVVGWFFTTLNWATLSNSHFLFQNGTVEIQAIPFFLGNRKQSIAFFGLNFVISLLVQSLLGSVVTIGEELGWRGYAQEKMLRKFGTNGGLILLGAIWGYWHLPIGLMGWNFPNHPILGALILTPISTILLGIYMGWLYLRSRSIWMPTLAHAAWNLCASLLLNEMIMLRDDLYLRLTFLAVWAIISGICLISLNIKKPVLWQGVNLGLG
jgi:membrane protease YdiL (CAAX protease family)